MKNIQATLERESRNAGTLVLWLDCDREGEAIGFEVMAVCQKANPRIRVQRARFSALSDRCVVFFRMWFIIFICTSMYVVCFFLFGGGRGRRV